MLGLNLGTQSGLSLLCFPSRNLLEWRIKLRTSLPINYSNTSIIWINWGRSSGLEKQKVALKDKRKLRTKINGKCNDISSADENK
jgi:hypothetical protein